MQNTNANIAPQKDNYISPKFQLEAEENEL